MFHWNIRLLKLNRTNLTSRCGASNGSCAGILEREAFIRAVDGHRHAGNRDASVDEDLSRNVWGGIDAVVGANAEPAN